DMLTDGYAPVKESALRTLYVGETYAPINRINLTAEQLGEFYQLKKLTPAQINEIINIVPKRLDAIDLMLKNANIPKQYAGHNYLPSSDPWFDGLIGAIYALI
ncbi:hypothetical protein, partial [Lacticaseibacillus paracasei]